MDFKNRRMTKHARVNDMKDPKQNAERLAAKINDAWDATLEDFGVKPKTYRKRMGR